MLAWLRLPEGKILLEYLAETQSDLLRQLTTSPRRWAEHRGPNGEVTGSQYIDYSDVMRGQIIILEELQKLPEILQQAAQHNIDELLKKDGVR